MTRLTDLLAELPTFQTDADLSRVTVTGVAEDSRAVRPGMLFIARAGASTSGAAHAADALARGAVAVLTAAPILDLPVPQVIYPDPAAVTSVLANAANGFPAVRVKTLGVTGTNGKTTTAYLIRHALNHFNLRCGMIGTVEIDDGSARYESTMTTPAAVEVADLLARMRDRGCHACAMEVSSHSLHQRRVAGVKFAGAAFTNLTGDHLDYHKSMDAYADAKALLFTGLDPDAVAVINDDDPASQRLVRSCPARLVRFGFTARADYRAADVVVNAHGSHFLLAAPDGAAEVHLRLVGKHNVENALAAIALLCETFHLSVPQVAAALRNASGAPGRLQSVNAGQPFPVLIDYAHTDDALANVLTALRPLTRGRLRVVFGCGGDRDATKRPRMAAVAERLADDLYVTSDNPRTENPQTILDQIAAGFSPAARRAARVLLDRRDALAAALSDAADNDLVLVAGKGHENYQIIGTTKHHFDDVEECRALLQRQRGVRSSAAAGPTVVA